MRNRNNSLPRGWALSTIGDTCLDPQYGWTTSAKNEGTLHFLRTTDITSGFIEWSSVPYCKEVPVNRDSYLLKNGDIVISRAGSVGISQMIRDPRPAVFASYLIRFRPLINPLYLSYFLQSPDYWASISEKSSGIAIQNVNATKLKSIELPLAPLNEQLRIVSKIEELFSKLDAGVKELKAAQEKLKQYRASVLAAACSGKLVPTEAELAKAEGRNYESGVELLERILKERREKWNGRGKYKEPILPDASKLLELPEGWVWTTWEQLSSRVTVGYVGSMKNEYRHEGVPFLRSQNVRANRFDPEGLTFISKEFHEALKKSSINGGDLAVVRSGSVGTTCVIPEDLGEANCSDLVLVQKPIGIRAHFGAYYMNSIAKKLIESGKVGVALTHFNTQSVAQLPVPLPPPQEQERIINTVEKILGTIETLSLILSSNLQRSERLRQSILQQAFSGKLVPQDENDEPASALLERIKAEQANTASKKSSKKSAHSNTVTE